MPQAARDLYEHDADKLRWMVEQTRHCGSKYSCIEHRTCLGKPICDVVSPLGVSAGFIIPTESAQRCGHCSESFGGTVCFCPMRWHLHRIDCRQKISRP